MQKCVVGSWLVMAVCSSVLRKWNRKEEKPWGISRKRLSDSKSNGRTQPGLLPETLLPSCYSSPTAFPASPSTQNQLNTHIGSWWVSVLKERNKLQCTKQDFGKLEAKRLCWQQGL